MISKITVVIPMYNREAYIADTITSILRQSFEDFHIIILDDASIDHSCDIVKSFKDKRITLIEFDKHIGHAGIHNIGNSMVKSPYTSIMDSDDIMPPYRLGLQYKYMTEHPEIDILGGGYQCFGHASGLRLPLAITSAQIQLSLLFRSTLVHGTALFRTSLLQDTGVAYHENYLGSEDWALWVDLIGKANMHNLNASLLKYRVGEQSLTVQINNNRELRKSRRSIHYQIQRQAIRNLNIHLSQNDEELFLNYFSLDYTDPFPEIDRQRILGILDTMQNQAEKEHHDTAHFFRSFSLHRMQLLDQMRTAQLEDG